MQVPWLHSIVVTNQAPAQELAELIWGSVENIITSFLQQNWLVCHVIDAKTS